MIKKGDTLIEVTLAVGIFSMIAIAIVAVMSGGTSSAQTALETTLAREEIDAQAEALRFIQASYIGDRDNASKGEDDLESNKYSKLWKEITNNAVDLKVLSEEKKNEILQYSPQQCDSLYASGVDGSYSNIYSQKAFIINPRNLGNFNVNTINKVYIEANNEQFSQATTYPHIVYGRNNSENEDTGELVQSDLDDEKLYRAEGIYVIAVKDDDTTDIISGGEKNKTAAFYDFYIRTCWYGSNAEQASTISTVIRLYDPDAIKSE